MLRVKFIFNIQTFWLYFFFSSSFRVLTPQMQKMLFSFIYVLIFAL